MSADYSTHTEADAAISAGFDAYPAERMSRADIAEEADFWHWWWNEGRHQFDRDPHAWPREHEGPLLEALRAALCDLCGVRAGTDHGLCTACADFLRDDEGTGE